MPRVFHYTEAATKEYKDALELNVKGRDESTATEKYSLIAGV